MQENSIVRYDKQELDRIGNCMAITNKILAIKKIYPDLIIEKTYNTPYINFNSTTGILRIEGRSTPFIAGDCYDELIEWVKGFNSLQKNILYRFQFEYTNTASIKYILGLLRVTKKKVQEEGFKCSIDWYYEKDDEYILEVGEHFMNSIKLPFKFHQIT